MSEAFTGPRLVWQREVLFERERYADIQVRRSGYLIKGILPERGVGFVAGASKGGKTFVALDWGQKIATGATVMTRKAKHVGVVYLGAEDPDGCRARIQAWKRRNPRQSYTPFIFLGRAIDLREDDQVDALIAELLDIGDEFAAQGFELGMFVVDTLAKCMPGADENTSADGSRVLKSLERIQHAIDAFVLVVAHHGKVGTEAGIRGWSGFDAASDATVTVERSKENPQVRTITLSKVKNGQDGDQVAFRLDRQELGEVDQDGEELWSCVVAYDHLPPEQATKVKRRAMSPQAANVHSSIGRLIDSRNCQPVPPTFEGVRPGTQAVRRSDLSLEAATQGLKYDGEKDNSYRVRFGRAINELAAQRRIRVEGDLIWLI